MEHFKEGQYDDDLTQGSYDDDLTADIEEYDEDFDTGDVDLFGYTDDEDSVLGRLKSIILSIEWEITDDILRQFNEELLDLKNIWAGNKVNLIYVQALEKISRYIYKEKSSAHPTAIKLLLTFYTNLEKIVSDDTISDLQQKKMLRADINLFEKLKKQISQSAESAPLSPKPKAEKVSPPTDEPAPKPAPVSSDALVDDAPDEAGEPGQEDPLLNLKAIVYGIDWEITERDLKNLSREVKRLEKQYSDSKAKKIFLQGIGSLGSYINLKRSDAHADAFKLLHSFYMGLETVVRNNLSGQAEKDVLLPEVEKFNNFKGLIADTIAPEKTQSKVVAADEEESFEETEIKPAFADVPDDVRGYQADDDEAPASAAEAEVEEADEYLDDDEVSSPPSKADSALASEMESRLDGMFDEPPEEAVHQLDKNRALQGVDVETEDDDDSDEEPLPEHDGELAPALAAEDVYQKEESPAALTEKVDEFVAEDSQPEAPEKPVDEVPGVDVEHEADDDSDEEPLPFDGDEYAPALSGDDTEVTARKETQKEEPSDIDSRLDDFFGESTEEELFEAETLDEKEVDEPPEAVEDFEETAVEEPEPEEEIQESEPIKVDNEIDGRIDDFFGGDVSDMEQDETGDPIKGIDVESPDDDDSEEEPLPLEGDELAPALSMDEEAQEEEPEHPVTPKDADEEESGEIRTEEIFADELQSEDSADELAIEDTTTEDETGDVDARFDELFGRGGDEEETVMAKEQVAGEEPEIAIDDIGDDESDIAKALDGVDVETAEDDDSAEEPLPFEDGEFAPALQSDESEDDTEQHTELSFSDEAEEHEAAERFDDLFGTSGDEDAEETQEDELSLGGDQVQGEVAEDDALFSEDELVAAEEQDDERRIEATPEGVTDYEEAGFEEIWDEDIEEIPEETLAAADEEIAPESQQEKEKEEILAYFTDDDLEEAEEDIPEMEADDFATVIDDKESSDGEDTSPGYASPDELLRQFDETAEVTEDISASSIGEEDDIPEMEVDDLATVIDEGSGITSAGAVPSGYPSADELLRQFGEVAGEEQADDVVIGSVEQEVFVDDEEDVVFEAVDETSESSKDDDSSYEDDDTFGITLLDDGEYGGKNIQDREVEVEHEEASEELVNDTQAFEGPRSSAYVKPQVEIPVQESLSGMRNCIASLGLEIDSDILDSMNAEIEKLRHAWMDKPAEKTFIQLLSTISSHINRYRYEADQEANKLLLSVFDKLELTATGRADGAEIQEALLNETSKVLQWQARLIDRVPAKAGSEESSILVEGLRDNESEEIQTMLGKPGTDEEYSAHLEDMSRQVDEIGNDMLMQKVSTVMKTELDQLKAAFQSELMELRKEILKGGKDNQ